MAVEGAYPKTDGDIHYASEVNSFYGIFAAIAKMAAQAVWNADYEGWNSDLHGLGTAPDETKWVFNTFKDASKRTVDDENNVIRDRATFYLMAVDTMYDKHNDSSISGVLWTISGAGSSEGGDYMSVYSLNGGNRYIYSEGSGGIDFKTLAHDVYIYVYVVSTGSGSWGTSFQICNNANAARVGLGGSNPTGMFYIHIDYAGETARLYTAAGSPVAAAQDISGLAQWRLSYEANSGGGGNNGRMNIYYTTYIDVGTADLASVSTNLTSSETGTITHAMLVVNDDQTNGSISYEISADNGSNYESVTPGIIHKFTNTGNDILFKAKFTTTATTSPKLNEFAIMYFKS